MSNLSGALNCSTRPLQGKLLRLVCDTAALRRMGSTNR